MVLEENGDSRNDGAVCAGPPSPGIGGAADKGEMGVIRCKHRFATTIATDGDHGTYAGVVSNMFLF